MAPAKSAKPADAHRRPVVAIPRQFSTSQRQSRSEITPARHETPTLAKSEKSDTMSGDERHAVRATYDHPMTPESLPSSIHKTDERVAISQQQALVFVPAKAPASAQQPNGETDSAVSIPLLDSLYASEAAPSAKPDTANGTKTNGQEQACTNKRRQTKTNKPRTRSLRILHEPPPEFHPSSGPSSTPLSGDPSTRRRPFFQPYAQMNGFQGHMYPPHTASRPVTFNPEANFQLLDWTHDMSRTPSHTSSVGPMNGDLQSPMMPQTPATFQNQKLPSAFALQDHILSNFGNPRFSDVNLDISTLASGTRYISAHSIVLYRSMTLRQYIDRLSGTNRTIRINAPNRFLTEYGFVLALKFLYGAPVLMPDDFIYEMNQAPMDIDHNSPAAYTMTRVLDYVAAGYFLDIAEVVGAGLNCARLLQRWDTVPTCLAFAFDGGLSSWWRAFADQEESLDGSGNTQQEPTFGDVAAQLLDSTLQWIIMALPINFQFNSSTTQLRELPRLPTIVETRPSQADPRLSLIQFGQMSVADTGRPDFLTTFISSILLSLPFAALKFLLEHPIFHQRFGSHSQHLAEAIVREREDRRIKVLHAKRLKDGKKLWEAIRWRETVQAVQVFPKYQLSRTHVADDDINSGS